VEVQSRRCHALLDNATSVAGKHDLGILESHFLIPCSFLSDWMSGWKYLWENRGLLFLPLYSASDLASTYSQILNTAIADWASLSSLKMFQTIYGSLKTAFECARIMIPWDFLIGFLRTLGNWAKTGLAALGTMVWWTTKGVIIVILTTQILTPTFNSSARASLSLSKGMHQQQDQVPRIL